MRRKYACFTCETLVVWAKHVKTCFFGNTQRKTHSQWRYLPKAVRVCFRLHFLGFLRSLLLMVIEAITKRYALWPAKVGHKAYFCYISHYVILIGGAEENRTPVRKALNRTFSGCRVPLDLSQTDADTRAAVWGSAFVYDRFKH